MKGGGGGCPPVGLRGEGGGLKKTVRGGEPVGLTAGEALLLLQESGTSAPLLLPLGVWGGALLSWIVVKKTSALCCADFFS